MDEIGIKAENDYTLVVTLEHPAPYFLELTANPLYSPICKEVATKKPYWHKETGPQFICNGPFLLHSWRQHSEVVLAKSPSYWDKDNVFVDKISFAIIKNPQTALKLFEKKELDFVGDPFGELPLEAIEKLKSEKKLECRNIASFNFIQLNTKNPLLASRKIRNALAMSINRKEIQDQIFQGSAKPAYSLLPEELTFLKAPLFKDHDVSQAKALFEEGLHELNMTTHSMPKLDLCFYSDPLSKTVAAVIQKQLQNAFGLKFVVCTGDRPTILEKITKGDFDLATAQWFTFYHDPICYLELFKHKNTRCNGTNWEDSYYTQLLTRSDNEKNPSAREKLLQEAESFVMKEMPLIPICYLPSRFVKNPSLSGESMSPIGMIELKGIHLK